MKLVKRIVAKIPLILCGVFVVLATVQATTTTGVLYFPLETYQASSCNYTCYTGHNGVDFAYTSMSTTDVPVYAPISGTVLASDNSVAGPDCAENASGYLSPGNYIKILDDTGVYTVTLMHMKAGSVETYDDTVTAGDFVGYASNTGNTQTKERDGENFNQQSDGVDADYDGYDTDAVDAEGVGPDGGDDDLSGDGHSVCGNLPTPDRAHHLHVGLKVNGVYADPTDYWIRDESGTPIKAETTSTTTTASTCEEPAATAAFYIGESGSTYYATNNTTDPDVSWSGVLEGEVSLSGSNATFTVRKSDGSTFTSSGTMYLKVGGYNSYSANRGEPMAVTTGATSITFPVDDQTTHEWCSYTKDYYFRYESADGGYTEVGPFTIEQTPALGKVADTDADDDGLDDSTEASLGTDEDEPDSDGDGLSDGFEVAEGLDPLDTDSNGDGVDDGESYSDGGEESEATVSTSGGGSSCSVPGSGNWTVLSNCILSSSATAYGNVTVSDGVTLTITDAGTLNMDLSNYYLRIGNNSRVIIQDGGKID